MLHEMLSALSCEIGYEAAFRADIEALGRGTMATPRGAFSMHALTC